MKRLICSTTLAIAALLFLGGAGMGIDVVQVPEELGVPFYTSGYEDPDSGWAATIFYRPPEWVPDDFNLLEQSLHPIFNIDPDCPLFVEGFGLREKGAVVPRLQMLRKVEGAQMPVYFCHLEDLYPALADGHITVGDLEAMDSLLVGWVDSYSELIQPADASGQFQIEVRASGVLEGGGRFSVHCTANATVYNVAIRLAE